MFKTWKFRSWSWASCDRSSMVNGRYDEVISKMESKNNTRNKVENKNNAENRVKSNDKEKRNFFAF